MRPSILVLLSTVTLLIVLAAAALAAPVGYYRQPSIHGSTVVFVAEGDVWKVGDAGGVATRLTSHPAAEGTPAISPDGTTVAFTAEYEGPRDVYTMPLDGGLPVRHTYGVERVGVVGWSPDGRVLFASRGRSTLPDHQLAALDVSDPGVAGRFDLIPLAQAADGAYDDDGNLFFTRFPFQGSQTKRYRGGTAQNIWRFRDGDAEAVPLTSDYEGTSKRPLWHGGRVYFASDRDGTVNLWSMAPDGSDLRQHTEHEGFDVRDPSLGTGRIVYQLGADLRVYDIASGADRRLDITLDSDLDQTREHWIETPTDYLTSAHASPDGDRVALTARGQVFVAPAGQGRFARVTHRDGVRYRDARFLPDGKTLLVLSDESGEVEFWKVPADGVGEPEQVTSDADFFRWEGIPSPDGKYIAHHDKKQRLFLYDVEAKTNRRIDAGEIDSFRSLRWSPDSKWLAYVAPAPNLFAQVRLYGMESGEVTRVTTDRYDSYSPDWSPDGKWLYLLSDRNLVSIVNAPWGSYQPEPYLDKTTQIFHVPLTAGLRSPWAPEDELAEDEKAKDGEAGDDEEDSKSDRQRKPRDDDDGKEKRGGDSPTVIELEGLRERLIPVPVPPGNYSGLEVTEGALIFLSRATGATDRSLVGVKIAKKDVKVETITDGVTGFELSQDRKKIMFRKAAAVYVTGASASKADLREAKVDLSAWSLSVIPRIEWRQMFTEAWRLERDFFYDRGLHGVDWDAMRVKYRPLVDRVTDRAELADLLAQLVSELTALHIYVFGGDFRDGPDDVQLASLGAVCARDEAKGGYRVDHIYRTDPDEPDGASPLRRPGVDVDEGDVITMVNGVAALSAPDLGALLRGQAGRQVRLRVKPAQGGDARAVIVSPLTGAQERDLRYDEWEYTRRLQVEEMGKGEIGYVHLRAMGSGNFTEWAKGYFPVFTRQGLIVDVRHNGGGNIESWILNRLIRKAWHFWSQPVGNSPTWNMQYAFRGHVVTICNERTASDGEIFAEGIRRLGIGEVIGTRTWGGEIWLSFSNFLVDRGIATAAEYGVYGPEGAWMIENRGVEPDIVVDNLPHETFNGKDAQLEAAVRRLQEKIREEPVEMPSPPPYPDKSFRK